MRLAGITMLLLWFVGHAQWLAWLAMAGGWAGQGHIMDDD
jgi:hypothetical protein